MIYLSNVQFIWLKTGYCHVGVPEFFQPVITKMAQHLIRSIDIKFVTDDLRQCQYREQNCSNQINSKAFVW